MLLHKQHACISTHAQRGSKPQTVQIENRTTSLTVIWKEKHLTLYSPSSSK
jgi:hypothetical protein